MIPLNLRSGPQFLQVAMLIPVPPVSQDFVGRVGNAASWTSALGFGGSQAASAFRFRKGGARFFRNLPEKYTWAPHPQQAPPTTVN